MPHSDKNIIITPSIGSTTTDPRIVFSGANATLGPQNITLQVYPTSNGTLSFEGSAGQLFSITNSLTGTIFSVNDVSGIPSIEVLDSGLVKLAQYSGNVVLGSGTDNATDKLQVSGSITGTVLKSSIATGTAPLTVASTTAVTNLNADLLDGNHASAFYLATNPSGYTTNAGTVTSVGGTGTVSGLTLTGTVTSTGNLTLGGTLAVLPSNFASQTANTFLAAPNGSAAAPTFRAIVAADIPTLNQNTTGNAANVTGTVAIANGGTGATTAALARTGLGATTLGGNLFTLANVAAIAFPRINADNTVSSLSAADFRTAIGAGTSSTSGTVTGVTGTAPIVSSGGTAPAISISAATTSAAGSMSSADKTKLDGIAAGATANTGTVTGVTGTAPIVSSGGTAPAISISAATTSAAGSMSSADKTKLDGIAAGATANTGTVTGVTGTAPIVSSGGTAPAISISAATTSAAGSMSAADKIKLNSVATFSKSLVFAR